MSYRKKHTPKKQSKPAAMPQMKEYGGAGDERYLSTARLTSGLPYQRPVEEKDVDSLIEEWNDRLLDPLIVSFRDGKFFIIDGQHRVQALRKMNGNRDVMVLCKMFTGMTYSDEAKLCYQLDKAKRRLSLAQSTNALLESGSNEEIADIHRLIHEAGFTWALSKAVEGDHKIVVTRAIITAYQELGAAAFSRMLFLLEACWHGDPNSLNAAMISGMTLFLKTYGTDFTDAFFSRRMAAVDPVEIVRRSKTDFSTSSKGLRVARVILEKYNKARGGKKLPRQLLG